MIYIQLNVSSCRFLKDIHLIKSFFQRFGQMRYYIFILNQIYQSNQLLTSYCLTVRMLSEII